MTEYRILLEQVESAVVYVEATSATEASELLLENPDDYERFGKEYVKDIEIFAVDDQDEEEDDDEPAAG